MSFAICEPTLLYLPAWSRPSLQSIYAAQSGP